MSVATGSLNQANSDDVMGGDQDGGTKNRGQSSKGCLSGVAELQRKQGGEDGRRIGSQSACAEVG